MGVESDVELRCARIAGGDWSDLYSCHLRTVKSPLTFEAYKAKRKEWERVMFADPADSVAKRKQAELEEVLGL